jgi:hypothetical protein
VEKSDEYRFFAQSTERLSDRRQTVTSIYISVNTAIFIIVSFFLKLVNVEGWKLAISVLPLFIAGLIACLVWHETIRRFRSLIEWRYRQLMAMERKMPDSYQMYIKESNDLLRTEDGKEKFSFSTLELWVPRLFGALYVLSGIYLVWNLDKA